MPISGDTKAPAYSYLNACRLGAMRLGYHAMTALVQINGVPRQDLTRIAGMSITQTLDGTPSTATLRVSGFTPTKGQDIKIGLARLSRRQLLFAGHIRTVSKVTEEKAANIAYDLSCTDYTFLLNRRKISAHYTSQSGTAIVLDLVADWTSGFTTVHVEVGLPTIDEITFTDQDFTDCLDQICRRIGGYWYLDFEKDLHVFLTASDAARPISDAGNPILPNTIQYDEDITNVITRVYVEGGGSAACSAVAVGETILPVTDANWYETAGGVVKCGAQRITYASRSLGGGGGLVGPGAAPSGAPALALASGAAMNDGAHQYAVTFVTAVGESTNGPRATITVEAVSHPASAPQGTLNADQGLDQGEHDYVVTFVTASGETTPSDNSNFVSVPQYGSIVVSAIPIGGALVTGRKLYRRFNGAGTFKFVQQFSDNTTTTFHDKQPNAGLGANAPTSNTATANRVAVSSVPIGGATVTQRKIYRTVDGGSQLKLLTTLGDNTTTTYADETAEGSLGANVPTIDTSGLTQPTGQVIAGSTSLQVTNASAFPTAGWAVIGEQVIRYTGISGSTLTGIPASGAGAIIASVAYNSTVTAAPQLTGIAASGAGSIQYAILSGDEVNLVVQRNNVPAQTALAALIGGDGIQEAWIQDRRLSATEAAARGDAKLARDKDPELRVQYGTRDVTQTAGRTVTFDLVSPYTLAGTFRIQQLRINEFLGSHASEPRPVRTIDASSKRFSFEDLLRQIRGNR